ncbi:DNA helicase [Tanacetum coccineum]
MKTKHRPIKRKLSIDSPMECDGNGTRKKQCSLALHSLSTSNTIHGKFDSKETPPVAMDSVFVHNRNSVDSSMECDGNGTRKNQCVQNWRKLYVDPIEMQYLNTEPVSTSMRIPLEYSHLSKCTCVCRHWAMCPDEGNRPRFLKLYIHDTTNEVNNRMAHFHKEGDTGLNKEIVKGLIEFLDNHNASVQLFRTARDKYIDANIPEFKVRLYNVVGTCQYELPIAETIGAIVFAESSEPENEFDLIVEEHSHFRQRVNKLHPCYMSLQFPLSFVYGEDGYQADMKLANVPGQSIKANKRITMNMYYSYQMHEWLYHYSLLLQGGKLFKQYIVTAYCAIEQSRLDYIRQKQNDIRNEYLSGIYDAILRGDRDGSDLGLRTVLTATFTGGPRYMYAHYLDALAICQVHGSPSFFITFTCNAKWPKIKEYIEPFPQLTTADHADIVDRIFEKKVSDYINFVRDSTTFGAVTAVSNFIILTHDDEEAVKECYKEYIGMVKIYYKEAQRSKHDEGPKGEVVGNSSGTAHVKDPLGYAGMSVEIGCALEGTPKKTAQFGVKMESNMEDTVDEKEQGSTSSSDDFIVIT